MKHTDFLRSLKNLRSRLEEAKKKPHFFPMLKEKNREKVYCVCKDSKGESKYLYSSQKELEYMLSSKSITLHAYPCPYEKGWHLTKN